MNEVTRVNSGDLVLSKKAENKLLRHMVFMLNDNAFRFYERLGLALHKKCQMVCFLCGPLRLSASSALKVAVTAEPPRCAEDRGDKLSCKSTFCAKLLGFVTSEDLGGYKHMEWVPDKLQYTAS